MSTRSFTTPAFLVCTLFLLSGCSEDITVQPLSAGAQSRVDSQQAYAITDQVAFEIAWAQRLESGAAPVIDFDKATVLVAFAGRRPTEHYVVRFSEVKESRSEVRVTVREVYPPPQTVGDVSVTSPYAFAVIPKTSKPIVFTWLAENAPR